VAFAADRASIVGSDAFDDEFHIQTPMVKVY
jgi:hypothetical protein